MSNLFTNIKDIFEDLRDNIADFVDDPYGIKRMRILLGAIVVVTVVNTLFHVSTPKQIEAEINTNGEILFKQDDSTPLSRGTKVVIMGYRKAWYESFPMYWATTEDGERGSIPQVYVDSEFLVLKDIDSLNLKIADKVEIKPNYQDCDHYILTTEEGVSIAVDSKDMKYFISERANKKLSNYERGTMTTFIGKDRFERRIMGEPIDYKYADYIQRYGKDSTVVHYGLNVISKDKGNKMIAYPTVVYNGEGIAQSYRFGRAEKINGNAKFILNMPFSTFILDHVGYIINNTYGFSHNLRPTSEARYDKKTSLMIISIPFILVYVFCGLVWLFGIPHFFAAITYSLLPNKTPFSLFSNIALYRMMVFFYWVSTYVWVILMLAYGVLWWILFPILIFISSRFNDRFYLKLVERPVFRCDKCKELGTKFLENREYIKTYIKTEIRDIVSNLTRGSYSDRVRVIYSDGHSRVGGSYVTRYYKRYKNVYNVDVYHATYTCSDCRNWEMLEEEERTLLSSTHIGSYSETTEN
ncbi:MAG: hypothetical protein R3Y16_05695 [Rikenellaceae bacterium]